MAGIEACAACGQPATPLAWRLRIEAQIGVVDQGAVRGRLGLWVMFGSPALVEAMGPSAYQWGDRGTATVTWCQVCVLEHLPAVQAAVVRRSDEEDGA